MVWIGHVRSDKFRRDFMARTFALIATDWLIFTEFSSNKTVPNAPKQYEMQQNMSLGSHGMTSSDATSWHEPLH